MTGFSTIQLTALPTATGSEGPSHLVVSGPDLFFEATDPTTNQPAVWVSDGTAAGTVPLALPAGASGTPGNLFAATGPSTTAAPLVYFTVGSSVYRSDGTAAGTTAVTLPGAAGATAAGTTTTAAAALGSDVILYVDNGTTATLWSSNGTAAGSTDLGPAPAQLTPGNQSLTVAGYAYFSLNGALYATNGSASQTSAQADTGASSLYDFTAVGNQFFFGATGGSLGAAQALDVVSGFGAGAVTLATDTTINNLTALNSSLLFVSVDSNGNTALQFSNGTLPGTASLVGAGGIGDIQDLGVVGSKAFFLGEQSGALNLYTTDGTSGGTTSVKALGDAASFTYASGTVDLNSQAAFLAPSTGTSVALWTSFGITNTTNPQLADAPAGTLALAGNGLLFDAVPAPVTATAGIAAGGAATGAGQLYVLNGTGAGVTTGGGGTGGTGTTTGGGGGGGGTTTTGGGGSGGTGTTTAAPALAAAITSDTLPSVFVPGDSGTARIALTNSATATATGLVSVQLYLSPDGTIADGVPLVAPAVERVAVKLATGKSKAIAARFTVPSDVGVGSEQLLAVLSPLSGLSAGQVSTAPAASAATATAALSFGAVGSRKHVRLVADVAGVPIIYQLVGAGTGTLTQQADGNDALAVTGTTAASSVTIAVKGVAAPTLDSISIAGPIAQLVAPKMNLAGNLTIAGSVRRVSLGNVGAAVIRFGGAAPVSVALGALAGTSLFSTDPISALSVSSWVAAAGGAVGTLSAASIGTLLDRGDLSADIAATSINQLVVRGSVIDSDILAGANFGANSAPGGGDDTFAAGTIRAVQILGSVTDDSTIAAGLSATDDLFPPDGNDTLLSGGRIGAITIRGPLVTGSLVLAAALPGRASVGGRPLLARGAAGFVLP